MTSKTKIVFIKTALLVIFGPLSLIVGFLHLAYLGPIALSSLPYKDVTSIISYIPFVLAFSNFISHMLGIVCFWWAMITKRVFFVTEILLIVIFTLFETITAWWFKVYASSMLPSTAPVFDFISRSGIFFYIIPILGAVIFYFIMFVFNNKSYTKKLKV